MSKQNTNNVNNCQQFKILHWNPNGINPKNDEFKHNLNKLNPDVISINETKLSDFNAKISLQYNNYHTIIKSRYENERCGGGVALLINKKYDFTEINELKNLNLECLCVKISIQNHDVVIVTYYNPPDQLLNEKVFTILQSKYKNIIICGDLNAKSKSLNCRGNNSNGEILVNIVLNTNYIAVNNKDITFHRLHDNSKDILDWILISPNLAEYFKCFKVEYEYGITSDHYPIIAIFDFGNKTSNYFAEAQINNTLNLNYNKAEWTKYKEILNKTKSNEEDRDIELINAEIINELIHARNECISKKNKNNHLCSKEQELPGYIVDLINHRKKLKAQIRQQVHSKDNQIKHEFNIISKIIRNEIGAFKSKKLEKFVYNQGKHPTSSTKFWKKIKLVKPNTHIQTLEHNNKSFKTNEEKAELFASLLSETFSEDNNKNFDNTFKTETVKQVSDFLQKNNTQLDFKLFTIDELNNAIKELNNKVTTGVDNISNLLIKRTPINFRLKLLHLFNQSVSQKKLPVEWKKAIITMIPKKQNELNNPKNYRPISLNSCIAKLCERLIANRIRTFLKQKKIMIKQQSGFRHNRQTKDNILHMLQKIQETFARKKKIICLFFDISQAFDKVWHDGLLKKIIDIKLPNYIIFWLANYLEGRSFCVKIEEYRTCYYPIKSGVPQGAVLSPLLFSLYINDVPIQNNKNKNYSLLFADDLATYFIYKKTGNINKLIKSYIKKLENWLNLWRLNIQSKKCNYMVFNKNNNRKFNEDFTIEMYNETIPACENFKFLGITFDQGLTFREHVNTIKKKCVNRLNLLKIISNRKWKLDKKTLKIVYIALIRSIFDYSSTIIQTLCTSTAKCLQVIQNQAIRAIYKAGFDTSTTELELISGLPTVHKRAIKLNEDYLLKGISNDNELLLDLLNEYIQARDFRNQTWLCNFKTVIATNKDLIVQSQGN